MKIHILGRNALNCALYLEFNVFFELIHEYVKNIQNNNKSCYNNTMFGGFMKKVRYILL